jgi:hypothetical protein
MQVCRTDAVARLVRREIVYRVWASVLVALGLAGTSAQARMPTHTISTHGVRITVPDGWRRAGLLSDCSDPRQVLALSRRNTVILVLERRDGAFPARSTFRLSQRPTRFEGCCGQPKGPGYRFAFRDHGRNFYAFVYAADRSNAARAAAVLNTLRVS